MIATASTAAPAATFFTIGSGARLPTGFDIAITVGVLQHVGDALTDVVAELARVADRIVAIEQVHDLPADRGGPLAWYLAAFRAAGLTVQTRRVRRGPEPLRLPLARRACYDPRLARAPMVPQLLRAAAHRLERGDYYDCLFDARSAG